MAILENYPINVRWSQNSTNKLSFTQTEMGIGISYKGAVVSNQLNGISYILSQALQYMQGTGGYYQPSFIYHKGNFVNILVQGTDLATQIQSFICVNDNDGKGITNTAPIVGGTTSVQSGVTIYFGGVVNSQFWKRVDIEASDTITPQSISFDEKLVSTDSVKFCAKLMTIPDLDYDPNGDRVKEITSKLRIISTLGTKKAVVNFRIKGTYIRDDDLKKYIRPTDYFLFPVPDIYIDDTYCYDVSADNVNSYYSMTTPKYRLRESNIDTIISATENPSQEQLLNGGVMPYGINFIIGMTSDTSGNKEYAIYVVSNEAEKLELEGESNIAVSITSRVSDANITILNLIPVRPNGGANSYGSLMELVEYDSACTNMIRPIFYYSRGQIDLSGDAGFEFPKYSVLRMLALLQSKSSPSLLSHTGRHTRCFGGATWLKDNSTYAGTAPGQFLEPGLPNVVGRGSEPWYSNVSSGMRIRLSRSVLYPKSVDGNSSGASTGSINANLYNPIFKPSTSIDAAGNVAADLTAQTASNAFDFYSNLKPEYEYMDVTTKSVSVRRCIRAF